MAQKPITETELKRRQEFITLLKGFKTAMLTTLSKAGELHSRPIYVTAETDSTSGEIEIWFFAGRDTQKMDELGNNQNVNLAFEANSRFMSVSGPAEVVKEREKVDKFWSDTWKAWFPGGKDDPNLTLVKVVAKESEYWDQSGVAGVKYAFGVLKAMIQGQKLDETGVTKDPSIHGKVSFSGRV